MRAREKSESKAESAEGKLMDLITKGLPTLIFITLIPMIMPLGVLRWRAWRWRVVCTSRPS